MFFFHCQIWGVFLVNCAEWWCPAALLMPRSLPRGQASGEALLEIEGDGEEVCLCGFRFLQLQCPSVVSVLGFPRVLWEEIGGVV